MGLISTPMVNLLLCTLKMMKINRQVKFAASYPNLVSFQPCSFMFDTNSWIENNHMKCSSHMAFLFVQNFTLLQKKNWIFCCKFNDKKKSPIFFLNHNFLYRNCQISIYGSSREQQIYKDVLKKFFHIYLYKRIGVCPSVRPISYWLENSG
jgi:hypothetical protein